MGRFRGKARESGEEDRGARFPEVGAMVTGLGLKEDQAKLVQEFRDELFGKGRSRPTVRSLDCSNIEFGGNSGCSAYFERFVIGFDEAEQGMLLTRIDPVLVP